uniref:Uncharacterized protein n=1 Tax=Ascaris lumbricoides TaxID=6252 RepID=A0A0M3HFB2_ASCLU
MCNASTNYSTKAVFAAHLTACQPPCTLWDTHPTELLRQRLPPR